MLIISCSVHCTGDKNPEPRLAAVASSSPAMSRNTVVDPAFRPVASANTGFHVWRIENLQVVPLPTEAWGKFFTGDSYIVLAASPAGESGGPAVKAGRHNGRVEQHIHFWLGAETSTDEAAIAAYKVRLAAV